MNMKRILVFLILPFAIFSCYDEYVLDYDINGVYFPNPINVRTVVVGEGLQIRVGAQLGGVLENKVERNVNFVVDEELITPDVLQDMKSHAWFWVSEPASEVDELRPLPSDYFSLSDPNTIVIKKGWHSGFVTVSVDSAKFLGDAGTMNPIYALPLSITAADADTIIQNLRSTVIGLRYENMLFGNYLHGGVTTVIDASGNTVETITYPTAVNQSPNEIMELSTVAPNAVATNGFSRSRTGKQEILLTLEGDNILISGAEGSSNAFEPDGASAFNRAKLLQERKLFLNYKYEEDGLTYHCQDTLTFRNRIRDGVNEWQDENPDNYNN